MSFSILPETWSTRKGIRLKASSRHWFAHSVCSVDVQFIKPARQLTSVPLEYKGAAKFAGPNGCDVSNNCDKTFGMKRRTLKKHRPGRQPEHHHHVYVVLLDSAVARIRTVRAENPRRDRTKPSVYVGMTGLSPQKRFSNHKAGIKAARVVKRYGLHLLPALYEHLNPMPYAAAAQMEKDLAEDLRKAGYTVTGGH
jgi:hypothetical protein